MPVKRRIPPKKTPTLARSELEVVDIPIEDLIPDEDNPNEMDEATFDLLIEEIRVQGFDEPIQVRPHPDQPGKYEIASGHHRTKAAIVLGMQSVPAVIKNWDDRQQKVALVKRNQLRGGFNKEKLAKLYQEVAKGRDGATVQRELGFSDPKKLESMIEVAAKNLSATGKKKLAEAKETIKTLDDLSSVLNRIFKEEGSDAKSGYLVFSFGGKEHHYIQIDKETNAKLVAMRDSCGGDGAAMRELVQSIIANAKLPLGTKPAKKRTVRRKPAK